LTALHPDGLAGNADEPSTSRQHSIRQPRRAAAPALDLAAAMESSRRLEAAMASLSPRLRRVAEGIRDGKSYGEIGSSLGISKQAAHKLAGSAIATLREKLAAMGLNGIDTLGLLKSGCGNIATSQAAAPKSGPDSAGGTT
jgi:DNA-directed RNA polymerase specialized sigma24 family protein